MRIQVTQEDINKAREMLTNGRPASCYCPVNLAAQRTFRVATRTGSSILLVGDSEKYTLPAEARGFIERFDSGEVVTPFEFEVTNTE